MSFGKGGGIQDPKDPLIYCEGTLDERESDSDESDLEYLSDEADFQEGSFCCCVSGGHQLRKVKRKCKTDEIALKRLEETGAAGVRMDDPCACHDDEDHSVNWKAQCQLIVAVVIAFLFMTAEVIGGYLANSLAIMTDAAHMLSDVTGFGVSLLSIWIALIPPTKRMPFGWHRAEVIGSTISVLIIWVLTAGLVFEAIRRIVGKEYNINADIMLITGCIAVFANVCLCCVLQQGGGHGHSHGGGGHGHTRGGGKKKRRCDMSSAELEAEKKERHNINVRAAFIHAIGDLIYSIGVIVAGYIIKFMPTWAIADPICTLAFSVLVMFSTFMIMRDLMLVLLEGAPRGISYDDVRSTLNEIEGVQHVHNLLMWSLSPSKNVATAHIAVGPKADPQEVMARTYKILKKEYDFSVVIPVVESYQPKMDSCAICLAPAVNSWKAIKQKRKQIKNGRNTPPKHQETDDPTHCNHHHLQHEHKH